MGNKASDAEFQRLEYWSRHSIYLLLVWYNSGSECGGTQELAGDRSEDPGALIPTGTLFCGLLRRESQSEPAELITLYSMHYRAS